MKPSTLLQISVESSPEAEDAVAELLGGIFARPAAVYADEESGRVIVSVYCENEKDWNPARRRALRSGLGQIRASGLHPGSGPVSTRRVAHKDWAESWKGHFKAITIGSRLLVKPSWIKRRPRKGQAVVVLDPGLSFGTGNHPTTAFCLRQLVACRQPGKRQSFWDAGTGSGILAISAAKLGYAPISATDFDPEAIRAARANARANSASNRLSFRRQDIRRLPANGREAYDLICANLTSNVLIEAGKQIVNRLRRDGVLVAAGILRKEFAQVCRAYSAAGLTLCESEAEGEWESGVFGFAKLDSPCYHRNDDDTKDSRKYHKRSLNGSVAA